MTATDVALTTWKVHCPACAGGLEPAADRARCSACGHEVTKIHGVWNLLLPAQEKGWAAFLESYTRIRRAESRTSGDPGYYRRLPHCPPRHPLSWQWSIRRRSFRALRRLLQARLVRGSKILDLGAGNGWLSNRLAAEGYSPCAVDLSTDNLDGLGAARHFDNAWPCLAADFDRLPMADAVADAVIFNASFHYSTDYDATLHEACRVTRAGGLLIILDSPVYRDKESGRQMLVEQHDDFARRFGDRSDKLPVEGFLTWQRLTDLGTRSALEWKFRIPWYGAAWAIRPFRAILRGRREPARFGVFWAVK